MILTMARVTSAAVMSFVFRLFVGKGAGRSREDAERPARLSLNYFTSRVILLILPVNFVSSGP